MRNNNIKKLSMYLWLSVVCLLLLLLGARLSEHSPNAGHGEQDEGTENEENIKEQE